MKIKINQKDLSKHINIAQKGISTRTTLQILDGILLETYKDKLKLTGTDLEMSIETYVDCEIEKEGSIVVNSKIFGDIIKKLPNAPIYIDVDNNNINIKCENSEFNILGNSAKEYPDLPIILEHTTFQLPNDLFKSAIRQTVFATTQDETRPSLTGVLLEIVDNNISFVALDGYRLALRKLPIKSDVEIKIIIPGRALNELNKIIEDNDSNIEIATASGHIVFNIGDTVVYSRLLEGQFFNYKEIIRKDHKTSVIVNKRAFQDSLERASLLAKEEKANLVKLSIIDEQILIKSNSEIGNVNEVIMTEINGETVNIAFNSRYILEGIKVIDAEDIQLNFMGSLNPCIINPLQDENYTYLVLPVRLAQDDF
ncbi:DNA polymerase III subunit beta [Tissierella sp.]|uniref:DNA polymerase III subunit beta n=1 Tax=Tissierella sp. TaxID=41274 RepID=UPI0028B16DFE|nr:DNA polymerase III subunit beta [Tissierella sp.]